MPQSKRWLPSPFLTNYPPSVEWGRLPSVVDHGIRACWSLVETVYAKLPDWAQPIVWALGLSAPVVIVAVWIWTVIHM